MFYFTTGQQVTKPSTMLTKSRLLAICALVAACGLSGYAAGKRESSRPAVESEPSRSTMAGKRSRPAESVLNFDSLLARRGRNPNLWKTVNRMGQDEVRDALAKLPDSELESIRDLKAALYYHWAEMDPHKAVEEAKKSETRSNAARWSRVPSAPGCGPTRIPPTR